MGGRGGEGGGVKTVFHQAEPNFPSIKHQLAGSGRQNTKQIIVPPGKSRQVENGLKGMAFTNTDTKHISVRSKTRVRAACQFKRGPFDRTPISFVSAGGRGCGLRPSSHTRRASNKDQKLVTVVSRILNVLCL